MPRNTKPHRNAEVDFKGEKRWDATYALCPIHRKTIDLRRENVPPDRFLILLTFGWANTVGGMAQTMYGGVEHLRSRFILTMAANILARVPRLLAA